MNIAMVKHSIGRFSTQYLIGSLLWGVSAIITASLYLGFAGSNIFKQVLMVILAVGLEGAKIVSWQLGKWYKFLAISLIALSGIASVVAALETVQDMEQSIQVVQTQESHSNPEYQAYTSELTSLDKQIESLLVKQAQLPFDFITASNQITNSIADLRDRKAEVVNRLKAFESNQTVSQDNKSIWGMMSYALQIPSKTLVFILLIFLSINIEVAALVLASHVQIRKNHSEAIGHPEAEIVPQQSYASESVGYPTEKYPTKGVGHRTYPTKSQYPTGSVQQLKDFLKASIIESQLPYLLGRDLTARKLGINGYEAKGLVQKLQDLQIVAVKGKRLVLNSGNLDDALNQLSSVEIL